MAKNTDKNTDQFEQIGETISKTDKDVYIYISHEHKDHFDVPFLKTLEFESYLGPLTAITAIQLNFFWF
mgnify:CR=1 FL=1